MKKIIALILAMMMILTMASAAFADEELGSITITGVAIKEKTDSEGNGIGEFETASQYVAYKMLVLESYKVEEQKYNYKIQTGWEAFFAQDAVKDYFTVDTNGYVEWRGAEGETPDVQKARAAEVAQLALAYAKANAGLVQTTDYTIDITKKVVHSNGLITADIVFDNLPLGYYLVDSTAGALCGLTTTAPDASFAAKNVPPVAEKRVQEDDVDEGAKFDKSSTAEIGQVITFDATITVHPGAENYVFHDKMSAGLEFVGVTSITHQTSASAHATGTSHPLDTDCYTINTNPTDDCSFEITFTDAFYSKVSTGDKIVILYTGKVTKEAIVGGQGNTNELWISYGNNSETKHDTTTTYVYGFDLAKTTLDGQILNGATFELYREYKDVEKDGAVVKELADKLYFVQSGTVTMNSQAVPVYRLATAETDGAVSEFTVGMARFEGLDCDTYWLYEKEAPENYNKLAAPQSFYVDPDGNMYLEFRNNKPVTNSGIQVVNKAGSLLPETGGLGTLLFTLVGGTTALGTGVVLVTKKRMSMIEDED